MLYKRLFARQRHAKRCPFARFAGYSNCAVVHLDNLLSDRETQPAAAAVRAGARFIGFIKALKNMRLIIFRNADPCVGDAKCYYAILLIQIYTYAPVLWGKLDTVVE